MSLKFRRIVEPRKRQTIKGEFETGVYHLVRASQGEDPKFHSEIGYQSITRSSIFSLFSATFFQDYPARYPAILSMNAVRFLLFLGKELDMASIPVTGRTTARTITVLMRSPCCRNTR